MPRTPPDRPSPSPAAPAAAPPQLDVVLPADWQDGRKGRVLLAARTADLVRRIARFENATLDELVLKMVRSYAIERGWQVRVGDLTLGAS